MKILITLNISWKSTDYQSRWYYILCYYNFHF